MSMTLPSVQAAKEGSIAFEDKETSSVVAIKVREWGGERGGMTKRGDGCSKLVA